MAKTKDKGWEEIRRLGRSVATDREIVPLLSAGGIGEWHRTRPSRLPGRLRDIERNVMSTLGALDILREEGTLTAEQVQNRAPGLRKDAELLRGYDAAGDAYLWLARLCWAVGLPYAEDALVAAIECNVFVAVEVDDNGNPQSAILIGALGLLVESGLDAAAIAEALKRGSLES